MTSLTSLWLPILLSAVAVFIVSSIVHMVLPHHRTDFAKLPAEDQVMSAIGQGATARGTYMFPYAGSMWNLIRWVSPRTIKETFVPPRDYRYPFLGPDADAGR